MVPFTVSGLSSVVNQLLPEPHAGLLAGLLFGTNASLSPEFYDALVVSGTLHIIALSGMNITIMEDLIGKTLLRFVGKRVASAITIGIVVWFVWFVGASPTIIRAAIMGSVSLIAVIFGRQYWALLSWGIAIGIMLIVRFDWLFHISFQLSAMATLGIILFGKDTVVVSSRKNQDPNIYIINGSGRETLIESFRKAGRFIVRIFGDNLRFTLAAQLFTIPIIMVSFRRFSLVSPFANLAIGWVIAPVTILGWATVLVGWVVLYAGQILAWIDWILLEYLIRTIFFISGLPLAGFAW